ncbi:hypothetical protein HZH66_008803 [Vespula vulgaris]|uniref:Uncharacterized protein n=1 Tax=Vespula vulgaris TaxID=7454 RepID=A0A834N198_VESVU|nr:hypothetical protein HZH66_008803 [Vespula vulgaris]
MIKITRLRGGCPPEIPLAVVVVARERRELERDEGGTDRAATTAGEGGEGGGEGGGGGGGGVGVGGEGDEGANRREIRPQRGTKGGDKGKRRPQDTRTMESQQWEATGNLKAIRSRLD